MSEGSVNSENVGVAFGLVIGAGAATSLGAGVVFVPALVKLASRRTLAAALGLSAGVMVYVSLVEIFNEANRHFEEAGFPTDEAYLYATISFFSGVIVMVVRCMDLTKNIHHGMREKKISSQLLTLLLIYLR
jgi:ZIP family zinc transporter